VSAPALSFVIPLYNSVDTIGPLVEEIAALRVPGGHEIILVDDGSSDGTAELCRTLVARSTIPIVLVELSRNFGEHNAVLTGWRFARGAHLVNLDDDGQNPPAEALRLWEYAVVRELDAVFGTYAVKRHAWWRNLGSYLTNRVTDRVMDKPGGFYLSSFRCVTAFVAREVAANSTPFPYIDGFILQITQRIGSLPVRHEPRRLGRSGYTVRRLAGLWLSAWVNFSVGPLRIATILGLAMALAGLVAFAGVVYLRITDRGPGFGWGSTMAALLVFSGTQLVMLGVIGEYIGRMFLTINQRPQAVVREVSRGGVPAEAARGVA
jgi:undecaprenyl-phosphate 4-deoxy-4-formamido-L-arabinose transferase